MNIDLLSSYCKSGTLGDTALTCFGAFALNKELHSNIPHKTRCVKKEDVPQNVILVSITIHKNVI
jgi:hypothetical protein